MNRALKTTIRLLLVAYLTVLYTVIIPSHGHEDLLDHKDCVLCLLSNQAATVATTLVLVFLSICLSAISEPVLRWAGPIFTPAYPTRAPPHI
jgi:hypothetical protein